MQGTLRSPLSWPTLPLKTQKNDFYCSLQMIVNDVPRNEVLLLLGDPRTRVECNNNNKEIAVGKHRIDGLTNSGERVINYCEENDLIIGETLYTHRSTHKLNWTSPDGRTQSQIDQFITNGNWRGSLQDVRIMKMQSSVVTTTCLWQG